MDSESGSARPSSALRAFLASEAAGGLLLMGAAFLAMIVANSPLYDLYHHALHDPIGPVLTPKLGPMTVHLWINDGLMALFFLFVGLEIKREFVDGRLASWSQRRLPFVAAASGMIVPAAIYLALTSGTAGLAGGWAIPAATDIAFAIGVLAFLGKSGVTLLWIYVLLALALWYAVLLSGVHATIAGVLAAAMIPIVKTPGAPDAAHSPLHRLEHAITPLVAFFIVPLFGFANAGVSLAGMGLEQIFAPLPLGIAAGLFIGKQIGIFGAVWLSVRLGFATRLRGATWLQIYGVSLLCGIGFTMSLFIGALAFPGDPLLVEEAKIGVLLGSIVSALAGYVLLRLAPQHRRHEEVEAAKSREIDVDGDVLSIEEGRP